VNDSAVALFVDLRRGRETKRDLECHSDKEEDHRLNLDGPCPMYMRCARPSAVRARLTALNTDKSHGTRRERQDEEVLATGKDEGGTN
jgi:hypothetical protein